MPGSSPATYVRLLDADPELGRDIPRNLFVTARRRIVAPVLELPAGAWTPAGRDTLPHNPFGALLLEGLVIRQVSIAGRPAAQLMGECDLLDPWCASPGQLPAPVTWNVAAPTRLAILDDHFLVAARKWPRLLSRLFDRAAQRFARQAAHQAICQLPHIHQRIVALFWHLADSWGRVSGAGVVIRLTLTHETIGRLVGAQRPTVTLALKELGRDGLLTRRTDGAWLLHASSMETLLPAADHRPPAAGVQRGAGASRGSRVALPAARS
jgi:CRP/FNR family transcriptional regulator, cyclic AMP receptor protein